MGKIIRYISIFLILIFAFVMRHELFHMQLANSFYANFQAMEFSVSEKELDSFIQMIHKEEEYKNCSLFLVVIENDSRLHQSIYICSDSGTLQKELSEKHIYQGEYDSFFSGSSTVTFKRFSECSYEDFNGSGFLISTGNEKTNMEIYSNLSERFQLSYPRFYQSDEKDMVITIWTLVSLGIIIICANDVLHQKKEIAVRGIYGENIKRLVVKRAAINFLTFQMLYICAKEIVFFSSKADYYPEIAFIIFELGCVLGSMLFLGLLKIDVKKVIANGNEDKGYLTFLKVLKYVTYIIVFFTLATNISSANHLFGSSGSGIMCDSYKNANFIYLKNSVERDHSNMEDNCGTKSVHDIWNDLYGNAIDKIKPIISIKVANNYSDYLILNENAKALIPDLVKYMKGGNNEVYVLYGKFSSFDQELVDSIITFYFSNPEVQVKYIQYEGRTNVSYIDMNELSGFGNAKNPIIIYCPSSNMLEVDRIAEHQNVMYDISDADFERIVIQYQLLENRVESELTNVGEYIRYKEHFLNRIIKFLSSLCIIILLLDMFIMVSIINLEYKKNGMEYAVKKILGYGIIEKNRSQIIQNLIPNIIFSVFLCGVGMVSNLYSMKTGMIVTAILIGAEIAILLLYITKMERNSVSKILKGGCL